MSTRYGNGMLVVSASAVFVRSRCGQCASSSNPAITNPYAHLHANVYTNLHTDLYTVAFADLGWDCDPNVYAITDPRWHRHIDLHADADVKRDANGYIYTNVDALIRGLIRDKCVARISATHFVLYAQHGR